MLILTLKPTLPWWLELSQCKLETLNHLQHTCKEHCQIAKLHAQQYD
jgi:hypothetical protein